MSRETPDATPDESLRAAAGAHVLPGARAVSGVHALSDARVLVGLMSGTSVDGIDAAVVHVSDGVVTVLAHHHEPFEPAFRARLLALSDARAAELALLHVELGRRFGKAANAGLSAAGVAPAQVAAIGSPGLTAVHLPPRARREETAATPGRGTTCPFGNSDGATLALGDGDVIAAVTGCAVVSDMRAADRAAGGHGAPLVPWANARLLRGSRREAAVSGGAARHGPAMQGPGARGAVPGAPSVRGALNLGGIANITVVPPHGDPVAFDTGPGNMLLDAAVARGTHGEQDFDRDGALGLAGRVNEAWLAELLDGDDFLHQPPPRSTGRERYGAAWVQRHAAKLARLALPDVAATLAAYTADAVALALERFVQPRPSDLVVSGGGALNGAIMARLRARLPDLAVRDSAEALGIPVLAMEAVAFALIADATLRGEPSNVPSVTGARRACVLGKLSPAPLS